jgi:hypothetical protein
MILLVGLILMIAHDADPAILFSEEKGRETRRLSGEDVVIWLCGSRRSKLATRVDKGEVSESGWLSATGERVWVSVSGRSWLGLKEVRRVFGGSN